MAESPEKRQSAKPRSHGFAQGVTGYIYYICKGEATFYRLNYSSEKRWLPGSNSSDRGFVGEQLMRWGYQSCPFFKSRKMFCKRISAGHKKHQLCALCEICASRKPPRGAAFTGGSPVLTLRNVLVGLCALVRARARARLRVLTQATTC